MASSFITLTTDFGLRDHFVGSMKGVIASIAPEARVIDITHEITPFSIHEGAYTIAQAYACYPTGTVHVIVVDPGVGSARRAIASEVNGHRFVAPDNGVLTHVWLDRAQVTHQLSNDEFFRHPVSATFHGRDIFAPVAAALANGVALDRLGPVVEDAIKLPAARPIRISRRVWQGSVLSVDRFGNLISNFSFDEFGAAIGRAFRLTAGLEEITDVITNYASAPEGEPVLISGSGGHFEVVVNRGSAAKKLGLAAGSPLELEVFDT